MHAMAAPIVAFLVGSIPSSQIAARWRAGVDLRDTGTGTVSGTNLYRVAGFGPLAVAGVCDVAKGAVGPLVAGDRPVLAALCGGLAVTGHNWSPWLRGAGGRGISPALGALGVLAWPGAVALLAGLVVGRLLRATAFASLLADLVLVPLTALTQGPAGAIAAACVVAPMLVKRVAGNTRPAVPGARTYLHRLLYDRDPAAG